jgi:hypothetical protein
VLFNTSRQYAACPNGHGKLHPHISAEALRRIEKQKFLESLPKAETVAGYKYIVTIDGMSGYFHRTGKSEHATTANQGGEIRYFKRHDSSNLRKKING